MASMKFLAWGKWACLQEYTISFTHYACWKLFRIVVVLLHSGFLCASTLWHIRCCSTLRQIRAMPNRTQTCAVAVPRSFSIFARLHFSCSVKKTFKTPRGLLPFQETHAVKQIGANEVKEKNRGWWVLCGTLQELAFANVRRQWLVGWGCFIGFALFFVRRSQLRSTYSSAYTVLLRTSCRQAALDFHV